MASRSRREARNERTKRMAPRLRPVTEAGHQRSPTAVAAEALQTGILPPSARRRQEIPAEGDTLLLGDPDDRILANEYVGEETPGGSTPTPDQNGVDDIGRAYGLQEEDTGVLRSAAEVLSRRDRRRPELQPPGRPRA
jgi:Family of unknown function (DUF6335)